MEPTTIDVANGFTQMCKTGDFEGVSRQYHGDDIVSVESTGERAEGKAGIDAKNEWWATNFEVHRFETEGPYVHGDQFILKFVVDFTEKESGQRMMMHETGLYTVRGGKVVEERFFSTPADLQMQAA